MVLDVALNLYSSVAEGLKLNISFEGKFEGKFQRLEKLKGKNWHEEGGFRLYGGYYVCQPSNATESNNTNDFTMRVKSFEK